STCLVKLLEGRLISPLFGIKEDNGFKNKSGSFRLGFPPVSFACLAYVHPKLIIFEGTTGSRIFTSLHLTLSPSYFNSLFTSSVKLLVICLISSSSTIP